MFIFLDILVDENFLLNHKKQKVEQPFSLSSQQAPCCFYKVPVWMESDKFTCNHMSLKVQNCFFFFSRLLSSQRFGSKINSITLASQLPSLRNFHHVISIKMVHMAIKTINKHFMSLVRFESRCSFGRKSLWPWNRDFWIFPSTKESATIFTTSMSRKGWQWEKCDDDKCHQAS